MRNGETYWRSFRTECRRPWYLGIKRRGKRIEKVTQWRVLSFIMPLITTMTIKWRRLRSRNVEHVECWAARTYIGCIHIGISGACKCTYTRVRSFRWKYDCVRQLWRSWRVWEDNIKIGYVEEPRRCTNLTDTLYFTVFYLLYMFSEEPARPSSGEPSKLFHKVGTFVQASLAATWL